MHIAHLEHGVKHADKRIHPIAELFGFFGCTFPVDDDEQHDVR